MPTYVITSKPNLLSDDKKDKIAKCITDTHTAMTGAPNYFAQVIFHDEPCRRYVGGKLADNQIWIRADIRSGRSEDIRSELADKIAIEVAKIAEVPKTDLWVFLNNLEACDMVEYGQLLSAPGKEQEWFNSLPKDLQERLRNM